MSLRKRLPPRPADAKGFAALVGILIVSAVGVVIVTALVLLGTGASRTSFALGQSYQAKALADACAELAVLRLRQNASYGGNETVSLGAGSCQISAVTATGPNRTIETSGTVAAAVRRVRVRARVSPAFSVTSWQEVVVF